MRAEPSVPAAGQSFTKHYTDPARARAAAAHHAWLDLLGAHTPRLLNTSADRLRYERVAGRHADLADIPAVAGLLGHLHGLARRTVLREARMNTAVPMGTCHVIPGFAAVRTAAVHRCLAGGHVPAPGLDTAQAERLFAAADHKPVAFYKDTNIRNVLITTSGPVMVDFDDLTLAPFGYDLGKLLLSAAMTHGRLPPPLITSGLAAYNQAVWRQVGRAGCDLAELAGWIEIHHILTSSYLGRHGYRFSWHTLRPW